MGPFWLPPSTWLCPFTHPHHPPHTPSLSLSLFVLTTFLFGALSNIPCSSVFFFPLKHRICHFLGNIGSFYWRMNSGTKIWVIIGFISNEHHRFLSLCTKPAREYVWEDRDIPLFTQHYTSLCVYMHCFVYLWTLKSWVHISTPILIQHHRLHSTLIFSLFVTFSLIVRKLVLHYFNLMNTWIVYKSPLFYSFKITYIHFHIHIFKNALACVN